MKALNVVAAMFALVPLGRTFQCRSAEIMSIWTVAVCSPAVDAFVPDAYPAGAAGAVIARLAVVQLRLALPLTVADKSSTVVILVAVDAFSQKQQVLRNRPNIRNALW